MFTFRQFSVNVRLNYWYFYVILILYLTLTLRHLRHWWNLLNYTLQIWFVVFLQRHRKCSYKWRNCSDRFIRFSYSHCLYIFTYLISNFNATNCGGMTFVNVCRLLAFSSSAFNLFFYRSLIANSDCETSDSAVMPVI